MNTKDKARELYQKMKGFRVKNTHAKKCALIAVDEIIEAYDYFVPIGECASKQYWQQVKQEIQNL